MAKPMSKPSDNLRESRLKGIYEKSTKKGRKILTKSLSPGKKVYDETIYRLKGEEYREWNPKKSKLGAAVLKGISQIGIMPGKSVLYLGCSTGTTCSHVSDMLGKTGFLFGVDPAPRVMREFVFLCEDRPNMAPIVADAAKPEQYKDIVDKVDVVFQDIAQRDQVSIFLKNCQIFLRKGGFGLLAVKARSIDVTKNPKSIFHQVRAQLEKQHPIVDYRMLEPYELDHAMFVIKKSRK